MVRVHRSGNKFEFCPPNKSSIKTRKSRRLSSSSSSSSSKAHAISSFPHGAVKITKPVKKRPPPSQSRANSLTGNKTVKEQRPAVSTVVKVPALVYDKIQDALEIIKSLETNPSEKEQFYLKCAVESIHIATTFYEGLLPPDWEFDPATASTIVWQEMSEGEDDDDDPISDEENKLDPSVEFPDIYDVSLKSEQSKLWLEFKKSVENTPTIHGLSLGSLEETATSTEVNHPYVRFIGGFAVDSFNKCLEMLVNYKHNYLKLDEVITCNYHKMSSEYWFHMTIKATEEGHSDVYESKVQTFTDDGRITLCTFIRKDRAPEDQAPEDLHVDGWSDPAICYRATGLIPRTKGFDFHNPCDIDRYWI